MNIQSPGECFSLSCFVVAARALTNDAEIVLATTHDGIDTDIKRTGIFESANLFANSINLSSLADFVSTRKVNHCQPL